MDPSTVWRYGTTSPRSGDTKTRMVKLQQTKLSRIYLFTYSFNKYLLNTHSKPGWSFIGTEGKQYRHCPETDSQSQNSRQGRQKPFNFEHAVTLVYLVYFFT